MCLVCLSPPPRGPPSCPPPLQPCVCMYRQLHFLLIYAPSLLVSLSSLWLRFFRLAITKGFFFPQSRGLKEYEEGSLIPAPSTSSSSMVLPVPHPSSRSVLPFLASKQLSQMVGGSGWVEALTITSRSPGNLAPLTHQRVNTRSLGFRKGHLGAPYSQILIGRLTVKAIK